MDQEFYTGGSALAKGREMTAAMMERSPELDFMYYSNDMIGAGGLLHLREQGISVPGQMGLAGFNKVELIDGLPQKLATMDSCRFEIGQMAAKIIASRNDPSLEPMSNVIELSPKIAYGDTLRRK
jgi:LacI family gluconate utilization system Gnt-I transcriptional repressor